MEKVRIDKWLWAVRLFKTRSLATEACKKGRVLVDALEAKPSREIQIGMNVMVRKPPVVYSYKVKALAEKRMSAKLVEHYIEDLTSVEELDKLKVRETFFYQRDKGTGRPTKKDRRIIDRLRDHD